MTTMQKVYLDAQAACGIKPGDWVKVSCDLRDMTDIDWWMPDWTETHACMVGSVFQVDSLDEYGVALRMKDKVGHEHFISFPYFVLEKTQKPCPFKPYDRVLVRNNNSETWLPDIFLHLAPTTQDHYCCTIGPYLYCIPYEGNEDLALTTNMPEGN